MNMHACKAHRIISQTRREQVAGYVVHIGSYRGITPTGLTMSLSTARTGVFSGSRMQSGSPRSLLQTSVSSIHRARSLLRSSPAPRRAIIVSAEGRQNIRKVNAEELEAAIAARDKSMVIDFFATWCGPCLLLAKELEKVADDLGEKVDILKLDVEENPDLAARLQIQGLPTMLFIGMDPQKPALRTEGLLPSDTIKNILQKEL